MIELVALTSALLTGQVLGAIVGLKLGYELGLRDARRAHRKKKLRATGQHPVPIATHITTSRGAALPPSKMHTRIARDSIADIPRCEVCSHVLHRGTCTNMMCGGLR